MLSSIFCGPSLARTNSSQSTATVSRAAFTGDDETGQRPRPLNRGRNSSKMSLKKKSRESFFCEDAVNLSRGEDDRRRGGAGFHSGPGTPRWWNSAGSASRETPYRDSGSSAEKSSRGAHSTSRGSSSTRASSPSVQSSPVSPHSPFSPFSFSLASPHPYSSSGHSETGSSPDCYFSLPVQPRPSFSRRLFAATERAISPPSTSALRRGSPTWPPSVGLPQLPDQAYSPETHTASPPPEKKAQPQLRTVVSAPSIRTDSPAPSLSTYDPREGLGPAWQPPLEAIRPDSAATDRSSRAIRQATLAILTRLNLSIVYISRVPPKSDEVEGDDLATSVIYQSGFSSLPPNDWSLALHRRALRASNKAIIYRRPLDISPPNALGLVGCEKSAPASEHASGIVVEVVMPGPERKERLVLAGFTTDTERRLGGEDVAVCKSAAKEVARLLRKAERKGGSM